MIREGVARLVAELSPQSEVVTAADGVALHRSLRAAQGLAAVLLGGELVGDEEETVFAHVRKLAPNATIGLLCGSITSEKIRKAVFYGAEAVISVDESREDTAAALENFLAGEPTFPANFSARASAVSESSASSSRGDGLLTLREREVLARIGLGLSVALIADSLRISPHTVRVHVTRIMKKLALRDRSSLMHYAVTRRYAVVPANPDIASIDP